MKRILFLAAGLLLTLAACQKENVPVGNVGGDAQIITVSIPTGMQTKATAADFGNGTQVNRCIMQVYRDGQAYGEQKVAAVTNKTATFELRLVAGQTYDFVFWADKASGTTAADFADLHYATTDLSAISVKDAYVGNNDEFDAFTGNLLKYEVTGAFSENITLKRPFGQLNVKTLDIDYIPVDALKPNKVKVEFTAVPQSFNALTGLISNENKPVTYTADVLSPNGDLTVDYIWAPVEESVLADFTMTFLNNETEICTNDAFTNIPIRRNYRTNVSGNLLTKRGEFNVTIAPEFENPDYQEPLWLREVFATGGKCTLESNVTIKEPFVLNGDKTVEINLNGYDIINTTSQPDGQYGNTTVFKVSGNSVLNIKGDGNVHAIGTKPNEDGYRMAVYAIGNAEVNIYGGSFMNDQDYNNRNAQLDLIYADQSAVINIYGGTFESKCKNDRGYWVLNLKDNSKAAINVYGGKYVNFDPSASKTENPVKNFVAEGYTSVLMSEAADKNIYEVVKAGTTL